MSSAELPASLSNNTTKMEAIFFLMNKWLKSAILVVEVGYDMALDCLT